MTLTMEASERKKRRINADDNDEDDDVKMEKFFALIRKANDIRDQLLGIEPMTRLMEKTTTTTTTTTLVKKDEKGKGVILQPCFEPEDFGDVGACINNNNKNNKDVVMVDYIDVVGCSRRSDIRTNHINKPDEHDNINININYNNDDDGDKDKDGRILLNLNLSL
ncbi:hypothetical protein RND81_12G162200 [Saponaria officinalis]|uniref:Uncharacterized protein n=1 Tax=Saponaria officinalis TaxID=3572 RepID=A0AAW1HBB3_SAPOF